MNRVVLANILTVIGELTLFVASSRPNKKQILFFQIICMALTSVSSFLLKGYSGVVMGVVGILRNVLSMRNIASRYLSYLFIGMAIVFGTLFNNNGLIGYLSILANVIQSLFILSRKTSTTQIRFACGFASTCWVVYNYAIRSYAGVFFSGINASSYFYHAFKEIRDNKKGGQ